MLLLCSGTVIHTTALAELSAPLTNTQIYQAIDLVETPISADIAGLTLAGRLRSERIVILDMDLVFSADGERLLPLLRLLKKLGAKYSFQDSQLTYSLQEGRRASIDIGQSSLNTGTARYPITLMKGISDISGIGELYVSERVFSTDLGLQYHWSDDEYAAVVSSEEDLRIFAKMREKREQASKVDIDALTEIYPETQGLATPEVSARALGMVGYSVRTNTRYLAGSAETEVTPQLDLYGSLFGGSYHMGFSGSDLPGSMALDDFLWTSDTEHFEVRAGDTGTGLTALVLPFSAFTGFSFRGVIDGDFSAEAEETFLGAEKFNFANERRIGGTVPLDSKVEVFINGRSVFSEVIEDVDAAAPVGQGRYELRVSTELSRSQNEVRTVITEPSGEVREKLEYYAAGPGLLHAGQTVMAGGAGSHKRLEGSSVRLEGGVAGLAVYRGFSDDLTLGFSVAAQEDFFDDPENSTDNLPRRYYAGQSLAMRLQESLYWRNNLGLNHSQQGNHLAWDSALEYYGQSLFMAGYGFVYEAGYSAGDTVLENRAGIGAYLRWQPQPQTTLNSALVKIDTLQGERSQRYATASLENESWLPRSKFQLRGDWFNRSDPEQKPDSTTHHLASLNWLIRPSAAMEIEWVRGVGDQIAFSDNQDLRSGIPVPMVSDTLPFGDQVDLKYRLPDSWQLEGRFSDTGMGQESAQVAVEHSVRQHGYVDMRFTSRINLEDRRKSSELVLEYPLARRSDLIGLKLNHSDNDNRITVYARLSGLLSMDGWRPYAVDRSIPLSPERGGVRGRVYLDRNANGYYDRGEPGVADVQIMVDGTRRYRTDSQGWFYIQRNRNRDEIVVSLTDELSALYTPTQGVHRARWADAVFTQVTLGIATLGSISGKIVLQEGGEPQPLTGMRVQLLRLSDGSVQGKSITDTQGVYYFGEVMPGHYRVQPDLAAYSDDISVVGNLPEPLLEASDEGTDLDPGTIHLLLESTEPTDAAE